MHTYGNVVLVLSGGNALGAYQAGAIQSLQERGITFDWVVGASTGAINGALICGNPPDLRIDRLRQYWRAADENPSGSGTELGEEARRTLSVQMTLAGGQPHIFLPRATSAFWPWGGSARAADALYDTAPLGDSLRRLVDFDRLNSSTLRFSVAAVEADTGRDVTFDTRQHSLGAEHIRASSGLLPFFPAVKIDAVAYADAGLSANLPVDVVLAQPPAEPTLCIAIDLFPLHAKSPHTARSPAERMQELMFANQGRRAIEAWQRYYDLKVELQPSDALPSVTLLHICYTVQENEVPGRAFDFSPRSCELRWRQGYRDAEAIMDRLAEEEIGIGKPGLTVYR